MPAHDFLFAIWDGGGTVPPELSVARALVERGHAVRVLADRHLAPDVAAAGAEHMPWQAAPQGTGDSQVITDHDARNPAEAFRRIRDGLMCGPAPAFAADVRAELRRRRADVVVADFMLAGAQIGAEAEGVPVAGIAANPIVVRGWGGPPLGPGWAPAGGPLGRLRDEVAGRVGQRLWDGGLESINATRRANGLAPVGSVFDQVLGGERLLLLISGALEYPAFAPPANVRVVGPRLADPAWAADWTPPAGNEPLVLVALSSTFQGQEKVLASCTAALGKLPVRGLVTTGPNVSPDTVRPPANVTVVESAPHTEVLRHAAAVVTHAGHGTMVKTVAAGVPQVCLPMGRDQLDNAARVVHAGAGIRLRPSSSPDRIAAAVRRVLSEPAFGQRAAELASAIADEIREDRAVAEIEALAANTPAALAATG